MTYDTTNDDGADDERVQTNADRGASEDAGTTAATDPVDVFSGAPMDLRPGSDDCYKCSTCDTECPVAAVDDEFPGPKFQGPEQWRLKRDDDHDIDPSIDRCSNCMRCDQVCPSGVPLSRMHNTARGAYVEEQLPKLSRKYLRNRLLANYGVLARIGSRVPGLTNAVMGNRFVQQVNEKLLGITAEREFPAFAEETFRAWYEDRGGPRVESDEKRVAYFHGDYANYNTPEVGKALVRVYEHFGYEVRVPEQRCSGTPMFANGMLSDARRDARVNVANLSALIERGYDVVCSCTSCSMALRQEYPELFDLPGTKRVAEHTYEAIEYLRVEEDLSGALSGAAIDPERFAYHVPCHARNQGLAGQTVEVLGVLLGAEAVDVGDSCSGISGTYGWKEERYDVSMRIGSGMFEHIEEAEADAGLTECPTCAMQMEHGTGQEVQHPITVFEDALCE